MKGQDLASWVAVTVTFPTGRPCVGQINKVARSEQAPRTGVRNRSATALFSTTAACSQNFKKSPFCWVILNYSQKFLKKMPADIFGTSADHLGTWYKLMQILNVRVEDGPRCRGLPRAAGGWWEEQLKGLCWWRPGAARVAISSSWPATGQHFQ